MKPPCRKFRYSNEEDAKRGARRLFWRTNVKHAAIYWCRECEGYHVTKKRARRGPWRRF